MVESEFGLESRSYSVISYWSQLWVDLESHYPSTAEREPLLGIYSAFYMAYVNKLCILFLCVMIFPP